MINFEKLPSGDLTSFDNGYIRIEPDCGVIDIDGSYSFAEFERILNTAKAASRSEQPQSTVATDPMLPGFVSLG